MISLFTLVICPYQAFLPKGNMFVSKVWPSSRAFGVSKLVDMSASFSPCTSTLWSCSALPEYSPLNDSQTRVEPTHDVFGYLVLIVPGDLTAFRFDFGYVQMTMALHQVKPGEHPNPIKDTRMVPSLFVRCSVGVQELFDTPMLPISAISDISLLFELWSSLPLLSYWNALPLIADDGTNSAITDHIGSSWAQPVSRSSHDGTCYSSWLLITVITIANDL